MFMNGLKQNKYTIMKIYEFITQEDMYDLEEKASRALCKSTKSNKELGASNLASCKSQGFRAREGKKSHKLGKSSKSRVTVGGHKIKGKKYGGPLPDWSESIEEANENIKISRDALQSAAEKNKETRSFTLIPPKGIKGAAVADLQKVLIALDYSLPKHGVDGIRGPETVAAIKKFQTDAGIKVDGIPGSETINALNLILKELPEISKSIVPSTEADVKSNTTKSKKLSANSVTSGKTGKLLDFIATYESGGNYNILVGGKTLPELTSMKIRDVYNLQRKMRASGYESTAIGRYQYIHNTLKETVKQMGLDPSKVTFNPKTQDSIAIHTLKGLGLDQWLSGKMQDDVFLNKIAKVWASIPTSSGTSFYQGVGSNKAGLGSDLAMDTLRDIKTSTV